VGLIAERGLLQVLRRGGERRKQMSRATVSPSARFRFVRGAVIAAALIAASMVGCWLQPPRYHVTSPDYIYITSRVKLAPPTPGRTCLPATVDLRKINGGDWQFLCILGGYSHPDEVLSREAATRGVKVSTIDPVPEGFLGIDPVEEFESAISFVDRSGHGRTILFDGAFLTGQFGQKCFGPDAAEVVLPFQG
jgi:hypothetical protein